MRDRPGSSRYIDKLIVILKNKKVLIAVFIIYFTVATPFLLQYNLSHSYEWSEEKPIKLTVDGKTLDTHNILQEGNSYVHMISADTVPLGGWNTDKNYYVVDYIFYKNILFKKVIVEKYEYYTGGDDVKIFSDISSKGVVYILCNGKLTMIKDIGIKLNKKKIEIEDDKGMENISAMKIGSDDNIYVKYGLDRLAILDENGNVIEKERISNYTISEDFPIIRDRNDKILLLDNSKMMDVEGNIHSTEFDEYRKVDMDGNLLFKSEKYKDIEDVSFYITEGGSAKIFYKEDGFYYFDEINSNEEFTVENEKIKPVEGDNINAIYSDRGNNTYIITYESYHWGDNKVYIQSRTGRPIFNEFFSNYLLFLLLGLIVGITLSHKTSDHLKFIFFSFENAVFLFYIFLWNTTSDVSGGMNIILNYAIYLCCFIWIIITLIIAYAVHCINKNADDRKYREYLKTIKNGKNE